MIGKTTKVYEKLADWLRAAGMADHELRVLRCTGSQYSVFLDGHHFAEYDSIHGRLSLCGTGGLYMFGVHADKFDAFDVRYMLPAKSIIIEI